MELRYRLTADVELKLPDAAAAAAAAEDSANEVDVGSFEPST